MRNLVFLSIFAFLLTDMPVIAKEDHFSGRSCPRLFSSFVKSYALFRTELGRYWYDQYGFFDPKDSLNPFLRAGLITISIISEGVKVALAPTFTAIDLMRAPIRGIRAIKNSKQTYHRLLFIPMDITARNGAHLLAYGALTAAGFNLINVLDLETFIKDIDDARPPTVPLLSDELVVLVHAVEKDAFLQEPLEDIRKKYLAQGVAADKIIDIFPQHPQEVFEQLGQLRKKGRIRDVHWVEHGSPGNIAFGDNEKLDDAKLTQDISLLVGKWPKDLMAPNSRLTLFSCNLARGNKGQSFVRKLGALTLQGTGTVIASTQTVKASHNFHKDEEKALYYHMPDPDRWVPRFFYQAASLPFLAGLSISSTLGPALESGIAGPDPVVVIDLNKRPANTQK